MYREFDYWYAEFPPTEIPNGRLNLIPDRGVVTAASIKEGQHATLFLERIIPGSGNIAESRKIDLIGRWDAAGVMTPNITESIETNHSRPLRSVSCRYNYHSWEIKDIDTIRIMQAIEWFKLKNKADTVDAGHARYNYKFAGGLLGRVFTKPGTRGVNCVDFVRKILSDAGIHVGNFILNTPNSITH